MEMVQGSPVSFGTWGGRMGPVFWLAGGIWAQFAVLKIVPLVKIFPAKHASAPVPLWQSLFLEEKFFCSL